MKSECMFFDRPPIEKALAVDSGRVLWKRGLMMTSFCEFHIDESKDGLAQVVRS